MKINKDLKISVIIPIYNEEKILPELLKSLASSLEAKEFDYELIFLDDNSTDNTSKFFQKVKDKKLIYLKKQGKQGKAFSLVEGFRKATGDIFVMIDGDLQYPPEVIPEMIEKLENADVIVANRRDYHDSTARKIFSKTFRRVFGKTLFGLNADIQSGLKVFKREVFDLVSFDPKTAWTFDLEFLHRATQAGFIIESFDITFLKRSKGQSSVKFVKTTFEIGVNALSLRARRIPPVKISPIHKNSMIGAGIGYKKRRYITHTTMSHKTSALRTFTPSQKLIIFLIVYSFIWGIVLSPLLTLQILVAVLSTIYFVDVIFNLYLIGKSLTFPAEITSTDEELQNLKDKDLPMYTILCPLYKEAHIIPHFLKAMDGLSWPKEKLDVILLLEEDDKTSIEKVKEINLPSYVRVLVVPDSMPKTKPKACNYGLSHAKGEYLVIYDAEDIPDPMQLKKAYLGFGKAAKDVICLQAKLNYYNPNQNLLTRFFTAEYSLWFDVTLTGLQSIETSIPLGGTSNHFRVSDLKQVEGWDPFNVTEDADLGMRLFRRGGRTAIIESVTLEEANSNWHNWLRQRSRWLKGYMQTYLVHARDMYSFAKEKKHHSLIFQLVVGGKIAFVLINPFLWMATIAYFALYAYVGPQIEALYPSVVFYMAVFSLVFGNFLFLYYYMIGVAKKGQWELMKYVLLIPVYWLAISVAAGIALFQLLFKPHYWEKTVHGLHLKKQGEVIADVAIEVEKEKGFSLPKKFIPSLRLAMLREHIGAGTLIAANAAASVLAFAYSAYLGRVLSFEEFALVGLVNSLVSLVSIVFGSLGTTMTHRTGFLMGKYGEDAAISFWAKTRRRSLLISIIFGMIWVIASPLLLVYFNLSSIIPLLVFSPILIVALAAAADRGLLFSRFNFSGLSVLTVIEPLAKFLLAVALVVIGLRNWAYATIPLAAVFTFLIGWLFVRKHKRKIISNIQDVNYNFPLKFFLVSLLSGVSAIIFMNLDVILAKHYLSAEEAGLYALTALIAKMVFFLGSLASPFTVAFVSRNEGANKDSKKFLNLTVAGTLLFSFPAFIAIAFLGNYIIPFMFGAKAIATLPYLTIMSFAMVCFSAARVFTDYYLAKKYYSFVVLAFILGLLQLLLLEFFHSSIWSFVYIMSSIWLAYLAITILLHAFSDSVKLFENNFGDLLGLFAKLKYSGKVSESGVNILIFNWRDTKHKWAGGAEVYIHELAKRWVKEGNRVSVFCGNVGNLPKNEVIDGVQIYRRGGFYMVYFWAALYYVLKFRGRYDVIIDSENGIPFFTPLYTGKKKFLLIHHVHQEVFRKSLKAPLSWVAQFLEAKLMPFIYRNVQVLTVSPSSKDEILRHKLTKTDPVVIFNGVDLQLFKVSRKSNSPIVLYLGRLQYYKSLNIFIRAAKLVLEKIPNAKFIIAGEGEEKRRLEIFAEQMGLKDKIEFVGRVSEGEKIKLMQKAWIFVNPSLMEGWGITTIEAAACGTPTIASDVPGLKDSIKNLSTGLLIKYGNIEGFAEGIIKLLTNRKIRKEMSEESIRWSQNFSWDKSAGQLLTLMNENKKGEVKLFNRRLSYVVSRFTSLF